MKSSTFYVLGFIFIDLSIIAIPVLFSIFNILILYSSIISFILAIFFFILGFKLSDKEEIKKEEEQSKKDAKLEEEKRKEEEKNNRKLLKMRETPLFFGIEVDGSPEDFILKLKKVFPNLEKSDTSNYYRLKTTLFSSNNLTLSIKGQNLIREIKLKCFNGVFPEKELLEKFDKLNYPNPSVEEVFNYKIICYLFVKYKINCCIYPDFFGYFLQDAKSICRGLRNG
jgi:hypothetical protein